MMSRFPRDIRVRRSTRSARLYQEATFPGQRGLAPHLRSDQPRLTMEQALGSASEPRWSSSRRKPGPGRASVTTERRWTKSDHLGDHSRGSGCVPLRQRRAPRCHPDCCWRSQRSGHGVRGRASARVPEWIGRRAWVLAPAVSRAADAARIRFLGLSGPRFRLSSDVGRPGPDRRVEGGRAAYQVLGFVVGGSPNARIDAVLREDKGFTYGIRSGFRPHGVEAWLPDQRTSGAWTHLVEALGALVGDPGHDP